MTIKRIKFFSIQILYVVLTLSGLSSFKFSFHKPQAKTSLWSLAYSSAYTICIICLFAYGQIYNYFTVISHNFTDLIFVIILLMGFLSNICRIILVYVMQIWKRNIFIKIINDAYKIWIQMIELCQLSKNKFFDHKCTYLLWSKYYSIFIQLLIIGYCLFIYFVTTIQKNLDSLNKSLLIYMLWFTSISSSVYFFCMLVALQYFRYLNCELIEIMDDIKVAAKANKSNKKMQMFCDLSDKIDCVARLYEKMYTFTRDINEFYDLQLVFTIIDLFNIILCWVGIS